jgi:hypothetical protein
MTLGNMREQGVQHLIAFRLHDACREHKKKPRTWRGFIPGNVSGS